MKSQRKFVFFATIKNINKHIDTYKKILAVFLESGCQPIESWLIDDFPFDNSMLEKRITNITDDSHRQLSKSEFAVCEFSEKSRTVIFQAMLAIEQKIPLLCLADIHHQNNIPELIKRNKSGLVSIKVYTDIFDLQQKVQDFINETAPLKKRFNIMLSTSTLKELELLSSRTGMSKADIVRNLIAKEYKNINQ